MNSAQIQLRLTLSDQLYDFLQGQANRFGLTVTQVVKHMILEKAQKEEFPIYEMSERTKSKAVKAMVDINKSVLVSDVDTYFDSLR